MPPSPAGGLFGMAFNGAAAAAQLPTTFAPVYYNQDGTAGALTGEQPCS